ncbi:ISAs1 family transposase [Streptomyces atratus]|uniref:ISAs1 family transposase n=1 Tax=Streptomyces atratus TaxID=1893 RepID=UPI0037BCF50D
MRTERDRACPNIIAHPIPSALEQLGSLTDPLTSSDVADLRRFLILVADPRDARGLRYPALALLCAAVSAVLTGARSLIAISEWITDAPQHVLGVLGFAADPLTGLRPVPHAATVRRLLQRVDGDALDAAISAYLQARTPPPVEPEAEIGLVRRVIAVDGKVVRGSRTAKAAAIQLLAAVDHYGVVLAQRQVASKSNEIPSFAPLLDGLELENTVVTADALHTQHDHGAYPTSRGAHYVAVVKKNHPGLYAQVRKLPWRDIPLGHRTRDHAHHRDEIRRLEVAAFSHLDCPGAR